MLQLKDITKVYGTAGADVRALDGVSLTFRKSEFVSILGQSGCGKTTLLNVIGGLDQYTSGDLIIDGRSTKEFRDGDWDAYRNHSVGFVFQSYNLIPHQTVLSNVELALTLSGVSKAERRRRATQALARVGLSDQLHKRPNQMSGGQMQRVAIARALVNDPEILLADEPTGALDSATSVQIMDILKEIAKDRLVIMVTHNPDIAAEYSTRIINLLDGRVTGDSNPCTEAEMAAAAAQPVLDKKAQKKKKDPKTKRTSMSFWTALGLSFNNLMTKKARTFLTSFAGSIGIIGIALILSVSTGVNAYINSVQQDTLSSYPITLQAEEMDMSSMMLSMMGSASNGEGEERDPDRIYSNIVMYQLMNAFIGAETTENNLGAFRLYMEQHPEIFKDHTAALQYLFKTSFDVYTADIAGNAVKVDAGEVFNSVLGDVSGSSMMTSYSTMMSSAAAMNIWQELIPGKADESGYRAPVSDMLKEQYELLSGEWPNAYDEVVLVVTDNQELSDMALYALGLKDRSELSDIMAAIMAQEQYEAVVEDWSYSELLGIGLELVLPTDYYKEITPEGAEHRIWTKVDYEAADAGIPLKITGIIKPAEGSTSSALTGSLGYTYHLTDYIIDGIMNSDIVKYQMLEENKNYDVLTGKPFELTEDKKTEAEKKAEFITYVNGLTDKGKYDLLLSVMSVMPKDQLDAAVEKQMAELTDTEAMKTFIKDMMAAAGTGISPDLLDSYIEQLSRDPEKLKALIRTSLETAIAEMYKMQVIQGIEAQLDTVTPAELAMYKAGVLAMLPDHMTKIGYLITNYELLTALPQEAYSAYLMTCTPEQIDGLLDGLLTIQGNAYLGEQVKDEAYRSQKAAMMLSGILAGKDDAAYAELYDLHMPKDIAKSTYEANLEAFGVVDKNAPDTIVIYVETFEYKEVITDAIAKYNAGVAEEDQISYTDYVALLMSSITTIINAISYVLIAFVAISLVVSSIMIGIITYISVLERTKEIGILRAIGASKRDVSGVFNAETLTIGFVSGIIGIGVTLICIIFINIILYALTGLPNLQAALPWQAALILVGISMFLTFIAGLFPSRIAAKKDPVVALRSE